MGSRFLQRRRKERPEDVGSGKGQRGIVRELKHQRRTGKWRMKVTKGKERRSVCILEPEQRNERISKRENLKSREFMEKRKKLHEKWECKMRKSAMEA